LLKAMDPERRWWRRQRGWFSPKCWFCYETSQRRQWWVGWTPINVFHGGEKGRAYKARQLARRRFVALIADIMVGKRWSSVARTGSAAARAAEAPH
jgi:hypothetical protein